MMRAALPAAALAAALVLSGCSSTPQSAIGAGTATALQQEVVHIAALAAARRYPAALTAAGTLRSDLDAAVETGRVPESRAVDIRAALALVEADLRTAGRTASPSPSTTPAATPARTATPAPTPTSTPTSTPGATATKPAPTPTPVQQFRQWLKSKGHGKHRDG